MSNLAIIITKNEFIFLWWYGLILFNWRVEAKKWGKTTKSGRTVFLLNILFFLTFHFNKWREKFITKLWRFFWLYFGWIVFMTYNFDSSWRQNDINIFVYLRYFLLDEFIFSINASIYNGERCVEIVILIRNNRYNRIWVAKGLDEDFRKQENCWCKNMFIFAYKDNFFL